MSNESGKPTRPHLTENYRPDVVKKNYVPQTQAPLPSKGVDGNYIPPTDSGSSTTPPPNPRKD